MVPEAGVEPARYRYHGILSPARLPIPSFRQKNGATGRNRTGDLFITSEPLYRLSHGSTNIFYYLSIISNYFILSSRIFEKLKHFFRASYIQYIKAKNEIYVRGGSRFSKIGIVYTEISKE